MSASVKQTSTSVKILRAIVLLALTLVFALALPLLVISNKAIGTLTDQNTYTRILGEMGYTDRFKLVSIEDIAPKKIIDTVKAIKTEGESPLTVLDADLKLAVEKTRLNIVAQIPQFVAGQKEKIEGSVDLGEFRKRALNLATKHTPGGILGIAMVRSAIATGIPKQWPLDDMLGPLNALLLPLRNAIQTIRSRIIYIKIAVIAALLLIPIISFQLKRALLWMGIALVLAGVSGIAAYALSGSIMDSLVPNMSGITPWKSMISEAVYTQKHIAFTCFGVGVVCTAFAFAVPALSRLGRRSPTQPGSK